MSADCFVDTNVFVYFRDASEPEKQKMAQRWLTLLWKSKRGRLSFQILNEYYVTVTQKLDPGMDPKDARADVRSLMAWKPLEVDRLVIEGAWSLSRKHEFWFCSYNILKMPLQDASIFSMLGCQFWVCGTASLDRAGSL